MSPKLAEDILASMRELESWKGQTLLIEESLSRARKGRTPHDRHFATLSSFPLELKHVGWAISGSSLTFDGHSGNHPSLYQQTTDNLVSVEIVNSMEIVFIEQFENDVERRSRIRRLNLSGHSGAEKGTV